MSFYTLIASLPHLPAHFDVERVPISWPGLEQRLKPLEEQDSIVLQRLIDFLAWDRQPLDRTDGDVVHAYEHLMRTIRNPILKQIVNHRIDVRTIVGALRRARSGSDPPVGVGGLVPVIRQHWNKPGFNLIPRYPWIDDFTIHMESGNAIAAERVLFDVTWKTWCQMASHYTFSIEAVLLYLARWSIVDRWTSCDAEVGRDRFEKLVQETIGEYAHG